MKTYLIYCLDSGDWSDELASSAEEAAILANEACDSDSDEWEGDYIVIPAPPGWDGETFPEEPPDGPKFRVDTTAERVLTSRTVRLNARR